MADPNELRDFQELYAELQRQNRKTPEYQAFCDAIMVVNEKMSILYRKDRYGRIPLVTEADKEELVRLHEELGLEAEDRKKGVPVPQA